MTLAALRSGQRDRISVAVAVTKGAAKLVPWTRQYPPGRAPSRFTAGAVSTVCGPVSEPDHNASPPRPTPARAGSAPSGVTVPADRPATATTPCSRAGYHTCLGAPAVKLPVQAITTTS